MFVHWNADEVEKRAGRLRQASYEVSCHSDPRANPRSLNDDPPDAFVIDLARIPSQGHEIGGWLWIVWPKKASGVDSDLSQRAMRALGLARGFGDYKVASIDATWSALCCARRQN